MCWEKVKSDYQLEISSSMLRALCLMGETNHSRLLPQDAQCFASSEEGGSNTEEGWEGEEMPPRKGMGESQEGCPQMAQQVQALPVKAWLLEFKPPAPK